MTRINCIEPARLADQHLLAEYREITRIAIHARALDDYMSYKLGEGHMKFFYDKGAFLRKRCNALYRECKRRGFMITKKNYKQHPRGLNRDWAPSNRDRSINLTRLRERYQEKPSFYRFYGNSFRGY
jgi:hypothetical protein